MKSKSGLLILKLLLIIVTYYIINAPFIDDRIHFYTLVERWGKMVGFLIQLFLALLLVTFLSNATKVIKWGVLTLFLINSIAYVTYYNAVGSPLTFSDFSTLFQAKGMASDAFLGYFDAVLKGVLIHIPFVCVYLWTPKQSVLGLRGSLVAFFFYLLILVAYTISLLNTQGRGLIGRPGFLLPTVQFAVYGYANMNNDEVNKKLKPSPRPNLHHFDVVDNGIDTLIMVIDESINWDLIDLNYPGNVTPVLQAFPKENILNFGKSISYANCSDLSNASIRKFVRYGQEEQDLLGEEKTYIWEAMQQAGFTSYLMDAQANGIGHNYFTKSELENINVLPVTALNDAELIEVILAAREAKPTEKQFFLIIKKGSHLPFFSENTEVFFTPGMKGLSLANSTREEMINTYKNQTRFETNGFFKEVKEKLDFKHNTALVYTSDHGQSFRDPGKKSFHCDTRNPDLEEAVVPLLWIGPDVIKSQETLKQLGDQAYGSHYFIPALLMASAGFNDHDIVNFTQYQQLLKPENKPRFVFDRAVPMFESSAQKRDIEVSEIQALTPQL